MGDIVLSASVRQNLLSLQSTADMLSVTQTRLATGKKVNTALDNPTNYFTAAGLDARASDINNLLDSIGNGVQVLQAANTGITSLQKLVDTAKSIANQALQTPSGYEKKSVATTAAIDGATADNLLGTGTRTYTNTAAAPGAALKVGTSDGAASGTTALNLLTDGNNAALTGPAAGDTITVNGKTITFATAGTAISRDATTGNVTMGIDQTLNALLGEIDNITGNAAPTASSVNGTGQIQLNTGTASNLEISGSAWSKLGLSAMTVARGDGPVGASALEGKTLDIASTGGGKAVSVTFGAGGVTTLDQLNAAIKDNNMTASISSDGKITFTTTNDYSSQTLGAFSGDATTDPNTFGALAGSTPAEDVNSQNTRANLISQYNKVIEQIRTTAQDASFNGVNLLNGDQLKLVFNETGKSTLEIQGVVFDPDGLGLADLEKNVDFLDNSNTNAIIDKLNAASTTLRSQASAFGSNLSVVQIRQDFNKNLINVLQTGSANLTLADTNEEAANSQALSTRQSIAVSALALANQSQQSVLQLLR